MGKWGLVVPTAATNYIANPAFTYGTTGWSNYVTDTATGTRERSILYAMKGYHSYHIDKTSATDTGDYGIAHTVAGFDDFNSGDVLALSAYVYIPASASVTLQVEITNAGGTEYGGVSQAGPYTGRITATKTLTADATAITVQAFVEDDTNGDFYISGVQVEKTQVTTYFDGFTPGCNWSGTWGNSASERPITVRKGGIETDFNSYGFYVTSESGLAAADTGNTIQDFVNRPGGYVQKSRTPIRNSVLTGDLVGSSLENLHTIRKTLFNLMSAQGDNREFTIYYDGANERLYLDVVLDGGFSTLGINGFSERLGIRLISPTPYWYRGYGASAELDYTDTFTGTYYLMTAYKDGVWTALGSVTSAPTVDAIIVKNGKLYVGGTFSVVDSISNTANFAIYDGSTWTTLGTGVNGRVRAIEVADNGDVYVGGDFTACGGVANTAYIGKWDESASAWVSISSTINGNVHALKIGKNISINAVRSTALYIGGEHSTPHYLARYDFSGSVTAIGSGISSTVRALDIKQGNLYFGGDFANISSDTDMSRIAQYDGSTFSALDTGVDDNVHTVLVHSDGSVYIGGEFATVSGTALNFLAQWINNAWYKVGPDDFYLSGTSRLVYDVAELKNGDVAIAGYYTVNRPGILITDNLLLWNGYIYYYKVGATRPKVIVDSDQYGFIIGTSSTTNTYNAGGDTTVTTGSDVDITPLMRFESLEASFVAGSRLIIHNSRNDAYIYYVHYVDPGEVLLIGEENDEYVVKSSISGKNALADMLSNSSFSDFKLLPGDNIVNCYIDDYTQDLFIGLYWVDRFWSRDGV